MKTMTFNMNNKNQNILNNINSEIGISKSVIVNNAIDFYYENYLKEKYSEEIKIVDILFDEIKE